MHPQVVRLGGKRTSPRFVPASPFSAVAVLYCEPLTCNDDACGDGKGTSLVETPTSLCREESEREERLKWWTFREAYVSRNDSKAAEICDASKEHGGGGTDDAPASIVLECACYSLCQQSSPSNVQAHTW